MQIWIIAALGFAFLHATVAILDKKVLGNNEVDAMVFSTIRYAINAIISFIFVLLMTRGVVNNVNFQIVILSMFYFLAGITYFYALKGGEISKLIPYRDSINVLLSFFLAIIVLNEKFIMSDFIGVALIAIGGYIVWTDGIIMIPKRSPGILLIAASGVFLALHGIVAKLISIAMNPLEMSLYLYMLVTLYFSIIVLFFRRREMKITAHLIFKNKRLCVLTLLASLLAVSGLSMLFFALSLQNAAKVLPFSGTLPLFAALIGWLVLKERHGLIRIFGSILLICGVYILSK